jgi:predicted ATPase
VHDDTAQAKLEKLDAVLAHTSTRIEQAALFAEMLSLKNDGRYPALDLTPEQRRQRTLEALVSQTEALTQQNPVLMIFEDAHWADPTSLEVFGRVVDRVRSLRVLLIVTFRPDFDPPWVGRAYVTFLAINRLGEREIIAMIEGVIGNKALPANIRQDIIERTDGIPLFVEEMTKAVLEAESQGAVEHLAGAVPSSALAVPASLQASLMARLDRLGPAKEVAQIGAAIGREFSHSLLAAVARKPETDINSALDRLFHAGLLFRQGVPPYASYLFKHALVQDAAYGTLLREPRRALHARIAEALESQFTDIAESQPELLARHCTEAGQIEKAVGLWGKAGQGSLGRSALVEAVEQITAASAAFRSTGSTLLAPLYLSYLARAHAELGKFDDAWRCIGEAMTAVGTTKEKLFEAELNRIAGEIELKSPEPDTAKAAAYFERALSVARQQEAKSWELRAAMSMARFWHDQGKRDEARELLASVYGWFTEGFDTRDLKEAKALLDELNA